MRKLLLLFPLFLILSCAKAQQTNKPVGAVTVSPQFFRVNSDDLNYLFIPGVNKYYNLSTKEYVDLKFNSSVLNFSNGLVKNSTTNTVSLGGNGNWQYNDYALITGGLNKAYLEMQGQNAGFFGFANNGIRSGYFFNPSQGAAARIEIMDGVNKSGAFYSGKYRNNLTDRWLTDKEYVDSAVSNSPPMITASNGVTKNGNDITLGDYDQGAQIGNIAGTKGSLYLANSTAAIKQNQGVISITDNGFGSTDLSLYVNTGSGVRQLSFGGETPISVKDDISHTGLTANELFPETDSLQYAQVGRVKQLISAGGGNTTLSSVLSAGNHANSPIVLADYYTNENDFQGLQLLAETGYTRLINRYGGNISNMLELHPFNGASLKSYNEAGSDGSQLSVTKNLATFSKINNANELINVRGKSPVVGDDFATKAYVDAQSGGGGANQDLQSVTTIGNSTARNVLIGMNGTPEQTLQVSPNNALANPRGILIKNQSSGSVGFQLQNTNVSDNEKWQFFLSNDGDPTFKIGQDNVGDYVSVKSGTGNVGIGTPIPQEKLDVNGNGRFDGRLLIGVGANEPDFYTSPMKYDAGNVSINKWSFYNNPGSAVYGVGMSSATGFDYFAGDRGFAWYTGTTNVDGTGAVLKAKISNNGDFNLPTLSGTGESLISVDASGTFQRSTVDLSTKANLSGGNTFAGTQKISNQLLVGYPTDQDGSALQVNGSVYADAVGLKSINGNPGIGSLYGDFTLGRDIFFQDKSYTVAGLDDIAQKANLNTDNVFNGTQFFNNDLRIAVDKGVTFQDFEGAGRSIIYDDSNDNALTFSTFPTTELKALKIKQNGEVNVISNLKVGGTINLQSMNTAPASATAAGTTGEIRVTAGFIYVCTATNTWVRSALSTW